MKTTDPDPEAPSVATLTAALIYLMTHYARSGCPRLAVCISRHLQCLAVHGDAPILVRDVCASLHGPWAEAARLSELQQRNVH